MGDVIGLSTGFGEAIQNARQLDSYFERWIRDSQQITANMKAALSQQGTSAFGGFTGNAQMAALDLSDIKTANKNLNESLNILYRITEVMRAFSASGTQMFDPTKIYASNEQLGVLERNLAGIKNQIQNLKDYDKQLAQTSFILSSKDLTEDTKIASKKAAIEAINKYRTDSKQISDNISNAELQTIMRNEQKRIEVARRTLVEEQKIAQEKLKINRATLAEQEQMIIKSVDKEISEKKRAARVQMSIDKEKFTTYEGAKAYASTANTEEKQAQAIEYLIKARKNLIMTDTEYADKRKELNKLIEKFRISIEQATKAEENENTLLPKVANEYARILVEIDKLIAKKKELSATNAYQSGDIQAMGNYAAMEARLKDLTTRRAEIEDSAQGQLDEIQRKHLAIRATDNTNALVKQEAEAKKRAEEFQKKFGAISSTAALSVIGDSKTTQNVAQAEKAIQSLKDARDKLDKTDTHYRGTVTKLNKEIERQEQYILSVTNREEYRRQREEKNASTAAGAMKYSQQAKSLEQLKKAMDYLQTAMDREDVSTKKGRENFRMLSEELQKTKQKYSELTGESKKFVDISEIVGSKLKTIFSIAMVQRYVNEIVNVRKEFELQNRALQAIIRDADKANQIWDKTVALAVRSPFTVKQLVTYTKQLAAYRIESDKLYDTTKMLADVSAGLGVDMNRLILAYGQVRAASYLRGTELRQFTEAGIPMLDELAKRFTDLEGKAVSVGEVFNRISKRMVTFQDVAAVFENLTKEGGTFYRMQEIQAETLYGQLSNLRDAMDIMFNEIGKANDGVLKTFVSMLRKIITNYREWLILIKLVGTGLAVSALVNFSRGMMNVIKLGTATIGTMKGLEAVGGKTAAMFKNLWSVISGHKILSVIALLSGLVMWMTNHAKAVQKANEKYDELAKREYSQMEKYKNLTKRIEENNKAIRDNATAAKEDAEAKDILTKAREDNKVALEELQKIYPDTTKLIKEEKDGIIDYNLALEEQNGLLLANVAIKEGSKGNFFHDDFIKNYQDTTESLDKVNAKYDKFVSTVETQMVKVANAYHTGKISLDKYNESIEYLSKLRNLSKSEVLTIGGKIIEDGIYNVRIGKAYDKLIAANDKLTASYDNFTYNFKQQAEGWAEGIRKFNLSEEQGQKDAGKWVDAQLEALGVVDAEIKNWARQTVEKMVNVKLIWEPADTTPTKLEGWRKTYQDKFGVKFREIIDNSTTQEQAIEQLNARYKESLDLLERMKKAGKGAYPDKQIKEVETEVGQLAERLKWLGVDPKAASGAGSQQEWLSKMISLIKDMNKSYEDLNKTFDKTTSKQNVLTSFADAFKETFKDTGLKIDELDFTTPEGVAAFLKKLEPYAQRIGSKFVQQLQKAVADFNVEIGIEMKEKSDEDLKKSIDNLFDRYEATLELKKLDIPKNLGKDLFKVDYLSLEDLRKNLELMKDLFIGKDMEKEYKKYLDKITDLENKARDERMKTYVKYLYTGMSESVKLKMEELKKIKEVEESKEFSEGQKSNIKKGIRREAAVEQQKQMWEDFKNSEMYTMMFEDMENMGTKAVEILRNKLKELKSSLSDLPANEMKEIVNQLNKADELLLTRSPFKSMRDSMKEIRELRKKGLTEDVVQKNLATALAEKQNYESELDVINKIIACQGDQVKLNELNNSLTEEQKKYLKMNVNELNIMANDLRDNADIQDEAITTAKAQVLQYVKARQALQASNEQWADIVNLTKKGLDGIKDIVGLYTTDAYGIGETIADATSGMLDLVVQGVQFYMQLQLMTAQAELLNTTMNAALGPLGWAVLAIQGIATIWKAIADVSSKQLQKRIDEHLDTVEKLQKSYEKLQDQIEEAYSTRQLTEFYKQSRENTQKQMQEVQAAITALEGTKKANQKGSEEYEQLQDLKEQLEELQEQLEQVGKDAFSNFTDGVLDDTISAAQSWTDSWLNAFEETGDGLSGLEEDFDDMLMSIAKKQATNLITGTYVKRWENELRKYIDPDKDDLTLTVTEAQRWAEEVRKTLPELSDALEAYLGSIAEITNSGNSLSGLEKGIQGMTEEQADILAAYWNSVRQYVADINIKMDSVIGKITINEETNPMLNQLKNIATKIDRIYDLMDTLTANYPEGGIGLKVITA